MMLISKLIPQKNFDKSDIKYHLIPSKNKSTFNAKIKNKKILYNRNRDVVTFKINYRGKIKHGFVVAEIRHTETCFDHNTPNLDINHNSISSFCEKTVKDNSENNTIYNIDKDIGKLDGKDVELNDLEWQWDIPEFAPVRKYKVKIGIMDRTNGDLSWKESKEDSFEVGETNPSHHIQRVSNV